MNLEGKTIKSIAYSEVDPLDDYGNLIENLSKEDRATISFTDGTSVVIGAYIEESPSNHWGDGAKLSMKLIEAV